MKQLFKLLLVLLVLTLGSTRASAQTEEIAYLDYDPYYNTFSGVTADATKITSSSTSLSGYCYVEGNVTISSTVTLSDDTYLILCDGATLTINPSSGDGINMDQYYLTIYAQSSGSHKGKLIITSSSTGIDGNRDVTINGGDISVTSTNRGIECNDLILNGGALTVNASHSSSYGIYADFDVTINGGTLSATGGTAGIRAANFINLGWTSASDFIKANSYEGTVKTISGKSFNYEGSTLAESTTLTTDQKNAIKNKTLTPNTTSYTITKSTGITGGTIEVDKDKAKYYERVAITVTPEAGNILGSLTYNDGTSHAITTKQANDYVFNMPSDNVTINATFGPPVAQIGATQYTSLQAALDAVAGSAEITIEILGDINEAGTSRGSWSSPNLIFNLNNHSVSFDAITGLGNLTIKGPGSLNCNQITNVDGGNDQTMTFDGCNVVCKGSDSFSWMANHVVLKNGANVEWRNAVHLGWGNTNFTFEIDQTGTGGSVLTLTDCSIGNGYSQEAHVKAQLLPYVQPGQEDKLKVNGTDKNTLSLRKTWGLSLISNLGANATVTFFDGGTTTEPDASTFNPSAAAYADANKVTFVDNTGGDARYIIAHIVPNDGFWTNVGLLLGIESAASLAPRRDPGLVGANEVKLLKADEYDSGGGVMKPRNDGAGWYYYTIPGAHTPAAGYRTSAINGFVAPQFKLNIDAGGYVQVSADKKTYTFNEISDWKVSVTLNDVSFPYSGSAQGPQIANTTLQVMKGTDLAVTFTTVGDHITISGTETNVGTNHNSNLNAVPYSIFGTGKTIHFDITKAALTVTAKDHTIKYGDLPANNGVTYSGFVGGETENTAGIFGTSSLSYDYKTNADGSGTDYVAGSNTGTYYIMPKDLTAANYDITFKSGKLTVGPKTIVEPGTPGSTDPESLIITIDPVEKPYNGADQKPTITVKDATTLLTEGTDYTVTYKLNGSVVTETKDAHAYDVVIASKADGNYNFNVTKTFTITPIEITITASDQTVTYGTPIAQTTDKVTISPAQQRDN